MTRIQLLEDGFANITAYTKVDPYRPGIVDLVVYNFMVDAYEEDEPDEFKWLDTPDHIMQSILDSNYMFTLEYGLEDLYDQVRIYLGNNGFVTEVAI